MRRQRSRTARLAPTGITPSGHFELSSIDPGLYTSPVPKRRWRFRALRRSSCAANPSRAGRCNPGAGFQRRRSSSSAVATSSTSDSVSEPEAAHADSGHSRERNQTAGVDPKRSCVGGRCLGVMLMRGFRQTDFDDRIVGHISGAKRRERRKLLQLLRREGNDLHVLPEQHHCVHGNGNRSGAEA